VGETRVDLLHLLEDLRDAYPGALEETILTEIVANALDSGAARITVATDPSARSLTVTDDGRGMQRRELKRYHDIATSTKIRGEAIGFAGVGIKLGLLACAEVLTETRRGKSHVASSWGLASRHRAPWRWVPPPGLVGERGTAVRLRVENALSPIVDAGFVEAVLQRHFEPLFDPTFAPILAPHYPHGIELVLNGRSLAPDEAPTGEVAPIAVRMLRKRKASALGYLVRATVALPDDRRGIAVSTFGKVIKRGWDWLGLTTAEPDRIAGLIEVPALAQCLTLNKADFIRTGARGATYLAYRKAIQEAVSRQLAAWGDGRDTAEEARRRAARPVERDLERVVAELSDDFPLLSALVARRPGNQRQLPMGAGGHPIDGAAPTPVPVSPPSVRPATVAASPERPTTPPAAPEGHPGSDGPKKPARYGLGIEFEEAGRHADVSRLVESTLWINTAHPAYRRAAASRSEGYHVAVGAALALARLAVEPANEHTFVTSFLARWGDPVGRETKARGRGSRA
jgi:Histidine kinase-, DNA gyrase B-, and HSP90-like ATPase